MQQSINSFTSFALLLIALNVVLKELLSLAKRAWKTVRALIEAHVLKRQISALVNVFLNQ